MVFYVTIIISSFSIATSYEHVYKYSILIPIYF